MESKDGLDCFFFLIIYYLLFIIIIFFGMYKIQKAMLGQFFTIYL